ncbi:MAG: hypothetical protein Q4F60_02010 [Candidatus Saccharibacteria bacterium]|nr:hypothetical protein [Candidatus Saccharibacteria bacterium]
MVCIAAFIILALAGIFVAILSIFKPTLWKKYLNLLKRSFHCFSRRIRLKKCDTNFSEDIKTSILKKVVLKKPKLVKPISITIEIASILVVIITAWSFVEAVKAGLALWVFGTCNVSQPSHCALGAESCSLDDEDPTNLGEYVVRWFDEWGEIFSNIPDRLKDWRATDYDLNLAFVSGNKDSDNVALMLLDPGCSACMQSYKNLMRDEKFLNNHKINVVAFPIMENTETPKFKNSPLIAKYMLAAGDNYAEKILTRIFTEYDDNHIIYQNKFNNDYSAEEAEKTLQSWLKEWGVKDDEIKKTADRVKSSEIQEKLNHNQEIVSSDIKPKGIPTSIYDGKKHLGVYKS